MHTLHNVLLFILKVPLVILFELIAAGLMIVAVAAFGWLVYGASKLVVAVWPNSKLVAWARRPPRNPQFPF
jgi:hypothetical protein